MANLTFDLASFLLFMIVLISSDISTSDTGVGIIYPLSPLFNIAEQPPTSVLKIGIS